VKEGDREKERNDIFTTYIIALKGIIKLSLFIKHIVIYDLESGSTRMILYLLNFSKRMATISKEFGPKITSIMRSLVKSTNPMKMMNPRIAKKKRKKRMKKKKRSRIKLYQIWRYVIIIIVII